ncbi:MAG: NAD(P)H-hydrate epimerase [Atopobiaceae bacterium]|nr:NAD(P)H-hydrate epimerase [Atopobiaceae bacterium]
MQPVLSVEDVRWLEQRLDAAGVSLAELMERAGTATAREVMRLLDEGLAPVESVAILCGYGNNGGDGWVAAQLLQDKGYEVCVVTPLEPASIKSDLARAVAERAQKADVPYLVLPAEDELNELLFSADVVVDALLGTGFYGEPKAPFDDWIQRTNISGARVLAVDVPSGLNAQTGEAASCTVRADATITMLTLKPGLVGDAARDVCGSLRVAPLADPDEVLSLAMDAGPVAWVVDTPDYIDVLVPYTSCVDKFSRGNVLVVGGSKRYVGAAVLAARAAARAGAGYVTLAVHAPIVPVVQSHVVEIPVVGMPYDEEKGCFSAEACEPLCKLARGSAAVVVGPGMTVGPSTMQVVQALLGCDVALVVDADALNCLARLSDGRLDESPELIRREKPLVLTPHRRELGRLVGQADEPPATLTEAIEAARRLTWAVGGSELCVVAKGATTACVDVERALLPTPGPVALATAGSGDVLAGLLGASLAKATTTLDNEDLALLCAMACETHGHAGSMAAERFGTRGVMAGDVADALGLATDMLEEQATVIDDVDA